MNPSSVMRVGLITSISWFITCIVISVSIIVLHSETYQYLLLAIFVIVIVSMMLLRVNSQYISNPRHQDFIVGVLGNASLAIFLVTIFGFSPRDVVIRISLLIPIVISVLLGASLAYYFVYQRKFLQIQWSDLLLDALEYQIITNKPPYRRNVLLIALLVCLLPLIATFSQIVFSWQEWDIQNNVYCKILKTGETYNDIELRLSTMGDFIQKDFDKELMGISSESVTSFKVIRFQNISLNSKLALGLGYDANNTLVSKFRFMARDKYREVKCPWGFIESLFERWNR